MSRGHPGQGSECHNVGDGVRGAVRLRRDRGSWGHRVGERCGGTQREDFWESEEMEEHMEGWGWSGGRSRGGLYSPRGRKKPEAGAGVDRCPSPGSEGGRALQWGEWVRSRGGLLGPALTFPPLPFPEQPSKLWVSGRPQAPPAAPAPALLSVSAARRGQPPPTDALPSAKRDWAERPQLRRWGWRRGWRRGRGCPAVLLSSPTPVLPPKGPCPSSRSCL